MELFSSLLWGLLFSFFAAVNGQAQPEYSVSDSNNFKWNQTEWSLETTNFRPNHYQSRMSLANGYVGASVAAIGPFFEIDTNETDPKGNQPINGWPIYGPRFSFSTISGFYNVQQNTTGSNYPWLNQYGWESFIAGIPHSTAIIFGFGDQYLDAKVKNTTISDFSSKMTFKGGAGEWSYTWTPEDSETSFEISYTAFFSRKRPNVIAVKASITASADADGTVTDLLDGRSAARSVLDASGLDDNSTTIHTSVHPSGLENITAYVVSGANFSNSYTDLSSRRKADGSFVPSNDTTIGQTFNISLKAGEEAVFYKFIGVASNDKFKDAESVARDAQTSAQQDGWTALHEETVAAWAELMPADSVDDFTDPETGELPEDINNQILHISSVANPYYLLQALNADGSGLNDNSISVGGLVSDSYAGLIFWDADYWMAPGLNLNFPGYSKQIPNYRLKQHPQALANAEFNKFESGSALYSWTSGRYGNCTGTGPCVDYQYHLNFDIAFNIIQVYNVTNNDTWFEDGPAQLLESVAVSASQLLKLNETENQYWIYNMTDPDEYANNIDNGAFTLASIAEYLKLYNSIKVSRGGELNETWQKQSENIAFPSAPSNITLEYETMNNSAAVKQADIVLLNYPLDYGDNYTISDKLLDLDYYANRQSPDGPAMTYSIFAIGANSLSPSGCSANTYTLNGLLPYLRAPFFQFSEQVVDDPTANGNTNPAFPFLTGHGGANQIVPFGFLGVKTDQPELYINPSLPPQISHVKVRTFHFGGATLQATMNSTHTTITRIATPKSAGITDKYANGTLPIVNGIPQSNEKTTSYTISIGETLTIANRMYWQELTDAGNLVQCLPVSSAAQYAPGQFPEGAVDGATATRWQPQTNETSKIIVNMTSIPAQSVTGIKFDWGLRPPRSAVVVLGNQTDGTVIYGDAVRVIRINDIEPNLVWNAEEAAKNTEVVPVVGNVTILDINPDTWSGNYALLEIEGCWEEDGKGATVGEFVLIGET